MTIYIWTPDEAAEIWEQLLAKKRDKAGAEYRRQLDNRLKEIEAAGKFTAESQEEQ